MSLREERAFYRAVRRAAALLNSEASLEDKLLTIVRSIARAMNAASSLVLLDAAGTKLVHSASWGLPQYYLRKGILDAKRSLSEVIIGRPVIIPDAARDKRVQYPELAQKARIVSILGVPVSLAGHYGGSIRVYARQPRDFTSHDIDFTTTMAHLSAAILRAELKLPEPPEAAAGNNYSLTGTRPLLKARPASFAHPSEEEFSRILDFYNMEWVYEPRSFPLAWQDDRVTEMFTPDFYLPGLDLYIELTTLKQNLVTRKNRKLRRLKQLYPEVNITLLYKDDYARLLAKYGCGPLAETRAHGIQRVLYSATTIEKRVKALAERISRDYASRRPVMLGVQRGFLCFMADLIRRITTPLDIDFIAISYYQGEAGSAVRITKDTDLDLNDRHVIMVEDIVDTGITLNFILSRLRAREPASLAVCTLLDRRVRRIANITLDYVGFEVPDEYVVGYGLDYREEYRNLPFIGIPNLEDTHPSKAKETGKV